MRKRGQMTKKEETKRECRIIHLRDKQHLETGGDRLLWREIGTRFGLTGERAAFIYRRAKARLENKNVKK